MAFSAIGAIMIGTAAYTADNQRKISNKATDAAVAQAQAEQKQQKEIANQQAQAARVAQVQAQEFETKRQQTLADNQKQLAAETALSAQNQGTSDLTPTVALASSAEGDQSSAAARKRRAQFRPEYASGITI